MSGASNSSAASAEYEEEGDSSCAGSDGVRTACLRGEADLLFCGEHERLLRGEELPEGVPPRRKAPGTVVPAPTVGSVLGIWIAAAPSSWSPSVKLDLLKGGNGSKEGFCAGVPAFAKPFTNVSLRLSGEGSTCRIVERVLNAVLGRSGDAGAVRGRTCVARMLSVSSTGSVCSVDSAGSIDSTVSGVSKASTGAKFGDGGAVAGKSCRPLVVVPTGYGGRGDSVGEETVWRMAKRRCRRWCNGEWLICSLSLLHVNLLKGIYCIRSGSYSTHYY